MAWCIEHQSFAIFTPLMSGANGRGQKFSNDLRGCYIWRAYAQSDNFCNPAEKEIHGFEVDDANLLILKWGMKTGFYFHKDDEESIGFIFDENATCSSHVSNICRAAFHSLYRIGKIRHLLNRASTERLIHAFITSRLDFCNSLLHHLPQNLTHKLQRIQNAAARLITLSKKHDHITPILIELHWLPVPKRTEFKILI